MRVTVVTTLYNYKRYIGPAIKSFLSQDIKDSEMIVVDDSSTDNPYSVIRKFKTDRLKYIKLDENRGYSYAKNIGIKNATSEVLVMLDADDMLTENSLSIRLKKIEMGYDFVHGPVIDLSKGALSESRMTKKWKKTKNPKYVHAQGVMLLKDIHRKIGLYDESLRSKSDREMFYRVFNHGFKTGWVNDHVAIYRKHGKQMHKSKAKLLINDKLQKIVKAKIEKRKTDLSGLELLQ